MENKDPIIKVRKLSKRYAVTVALDKVSIDIHSGSVHSLVGENGAGKSTLMKILVGSEQMDEGSIIYKNQDYRPVSTIDAASAGISMVWQEQNLIPTISIAENLFLGHLDKFKKMGLIHWKRVYNEAQNILKMVKLKNLNPQILVQSLSLDIRKMIEFAKALSQNPEVLILDEITACLPQDHIDTVFEWIRKLQSENKSVLYISHRMEELFEICDTATVLRDGCVVETVDVKGLDLETLSTMTVGRDIKSGYEFFNNYKNKFDRNSPIVLEAENLTQKGVFENVSFNVKQGEIVGIAGLDGAGSENILESLFGLTHFDSGSIRIFGKEYTPRNPRHAIDNKLAYVPKIRETQGNIDVFTVKENITLSVLNRLSRMGSLNLKKEKELADSYFKKLQIKAAGLDALETSLSGGNKQKLVLAKWLATNGDIYLLNNPTRGVDVGVKMNIYELIFEIANHGAAVLLVSSEMPELIRMSHRIYTMRQGLLTSEFEQYDAAVEEERLIVKMI